MLVTRVGVIYYQFRTITELSSDAMCNYLGQEKWVTDFDNTFHSEFVASIPTPWIDSETGKVAGEVRSAGGAGFTAGNLTLVTVYEAG